MNKKNNSKKFRCAICTTPVRTRYHSFILFLLKVILVVFVIFFFLLPDVVLYPSEMLHHAGVHTRLLGVSAFLEKKNS